MALPVCGIATGNLRSGVEPVLAHAPALRSSIELADDDLLRMILGLRTYSVQPAARQPLIDFMVNGLRDAGCRVLFVSEPDRAPFIITFETREGERLGIVAYAFLATRTPTRNRPDDERSFQIKYGSKEDYRHNNTHELWQDPLGLFTTLLIGIDPAEGFFVAVDPEMHNPTKFFIRLEFKDEHAEAIKRQGWFAWERQRRAPKGLSEPIEVLVGGRQELFLDLVRFERIAKGFPPGERQLLAEQRYRFAQVPEGVRDHRETPLEQETLHPLVKEFQLSPDEILEVIAGARRLKMAVRGWVAEEHLRERLANVDGVTHCERVDEEGGPDIRLRYRGGPPLTIECKNVLRIRSREGYPRLDFQRTRTSKSDPCSRYYSARDFDVLAACLHAVTENWEFRYVLPSALPSHGRCPGKLTNNIVVTPDWTEDPSRVFEAAYAGAASK